MWNTYAWTDSRVMLGWLRGDPRSFRVFVGNRVSEILELTPPNYGGTCQARTTLVIARHAGCILTNWPTIHKCGMGQNRYISQKASGQYLRIRANIYYDTEEERDPDLWRIVLQTSNQVDPLPLLQRAYPVIRD